MALSPTITVKDREILMSYGLLTESARLLPTPDHIGELFSNSETRDKYLSILLVQRDAKGKPIGEADLGDLSLEDAGAVLDWGMEHLTDFFVKRAALAQKLHKGVNATLQGAS